LRVGVCEGKDGRLKVRERVGGVVGVRCEKGGRELSERRLKRREKGKKRKREREKEKRAEKGSIARFLLFIRHKREERLCRMVFFGEGE